MLNTRGLSLADSPPYRLPLRFFLVAPPFAVTAGLLFVVEGGPLLQSRWTPATLAITHLLVLGFLGMIMCGSLLQLLPVLLGSDRSASLSQGALMVAALSSGSLLLALGFGLVNTYLLLTGVALVAMSLLLFVALSARALRSATGPSGPRISVAMALVALTVTVALGLVLGVSQAGWLVLPDPQAWVNIHLAWGLVGWMGLLLIAIAGEILPMFYLSPAYPRWLKRLLPVAVLLLLLMTLLQPLLPGEHALFNAIGLLLVISPVLFAGTGFILLFRRRRPRRDATLGFWWLGQASIMLAALAWLAGLPVTLVGVLAIVGGAMSFTSGTLYKIVPFLSWYHLQTRKVMQRQSDIKLPTMQGFIGERPARWQLATHCVAVLCLSLAAWPGMPTARLGGVMLTLSALLLWGSLLRANLRYRSIARSLDTEA